MNSQGDVNFSNEYKENFINNDIEKNKGTFDDAKPVKVIKIYF